jgi:hypothetical protein
MGDIRNRFQPENKSTFPGPPFGSAQGPGHPLEEAEKKGRP